MKKYNNMSTNKKNTADNIFLERIKDILEEQYAKGFSDALMVSHEKPAKLLCKEK